MGSRKKHHSSAHLQNLLRIIRTKLPCFEALNFNHVYREFNSEVDILSKQALAIQPGIIEGEIFDEGDSIMFHILLWRNREGWSWFLKADRRQGDEKAKVQYCNDNTVMESTDSVHFVMKAMKLSTPSKVILWKSC